MATLGIANRISLAVLTIATEQYLKTGTLDVPYLTEQLRIEYRGELRLKKAVMQLSAFFHNNAILPFVNVHKEDLLTAMNNANNRTIIAMSIMIAKSPFVYDMVCQMARLFHVEDMISTATIVRVMGNKYGSNKNMNNTLYMVIPTLVEAGLFSRPKPGLYAYQPPLAISPVAYEMWREAFYVNNPLYDRDNTDTLVMEPFFQFASLK